MAVLFLSLFFRHSRKQPKFPSCKHNSKAYKCGSLTIRDVSHFNAAFYKVPNKITQDFFILKYTGVDHPRRSRSKPDTSGKVVPKRVVSITYFVKKAIRSSGQTNSVVPVCRQTFLDILQISKYRVQSICKKHLETGHMPTELRGGDRYIKRFELKKASIANFIKKLKPIESHYCRDKTVSRVYVSSDLNINKIWRYYNENVSDDFKVKKSYFRTFFNANFNIGFGTPSTDACSYCIMTKEKLKEVRQKKKEMKL